MDKINQFVKAYLGLIEFHANFNKIIISSLLRFYDTNEEIKTILQEMDNNNDDQLLFTTVRNVAEISPNDMIEVISRIGMVNFALFQSCLSLEKTDSTPPVAYLFDKLKDSITTIIVYYDDLLCTTLVSLPEEIKDQALNSIDPDNIPVIVVSLENTVGMNPNDEEAKKILQELQKKMMFLPAEEEKDYFEDKIQK